MSKQRVRAVGHILLTIPLMISTGAQATDQASAGLGRFEVAQLLSPEEAARRKKEAEERAKKGGGQPPQGQQRPPEARRPPQGPQSPKSSTIVPPEKKSPFLEKRIVPPAPRNAMPVPPPQPQPKVITVIPPKAPTAVIPPKMPSAIIPPKAPTALIPPKAPEGVRVAPVIPPKAPSAATVVIPKAPEGVRVAPPGAPSQFTRSVRPIIPPPNVEVLKKTRETRVEGQKTVIREQGNRTIVKEGNKSFIRHDEAERFRHLNNARTFQRPGGITETFYVRPDGVRVVTEVDRSGRLLRRYRRGPDGREHNLVDNRKFWRNAGIAVGIGAVGTLIALNLAPPRVTIPRERYIVEYDRVSDNDIYDTLIAPPVDTIDRAYSLEEVRGSFELRERMRRVDLDSINFEFGSSEVTPDQFGKLERLAKAIQRVLRDNPDSVFMIEGHTDAVGNDVDNLSLSDRRAQSVAQILSENFGIPPENLVTQGYGEQYLKVSTQEAERANRRVAVRNVTALMAERR